MYLLGIYILYWDIILVCSAMFVGSIIGRVLENLFLVFSIRVGTPLKYLILFYLFFAENIPLRILVW